MQGDNTQAPELTKWNYLGNPITRQYDFNLGGGRVLVRDKLWLNGELRDWSVNKFSNARNADGSRAIDDNTIHNYFLKGVWQAATNHKFALSYTYDNKVRGHRRGGADFISDIASLHQDNPASIYQAKYRGVYSDQKLAVWRLGAVYDLNGDGKTALKASYSRDGGQIGIDRVTSVNPAGESDQTCPWTDVNGDGMATANEIGQCSGFSTKSVHYADANGPAWPYSDEITAGVERELPGDMRFGVM